MHMKSAQLDIVLVNNETGETLDQKPSNCHESGAQVVMIPVTQITTRVCQRVPVKQ